MKILYYSLLKMQNPQTSTDTRDVQFSKPLKNTINLAR